MVECTVVPACECLDLSHMHGEHLKSIVANVIMTCWHCLSRLTIVRKNCFFGSWMKDSHASGEEMIMRRQHCAQFAHVSNKLNLGQIPETILEGNRDKNLHKPSRGMTRSPNKSRKKEWRKIFVIYRAMHSLWNILPWAWWSSFGAFQFYVVQNLLFWDKAFVCQQFFLFEFHVGCGTNCTATEKKTCV